MKVARNTTHNLRHDWLSVTANKNAAAISLLACRSEVYIDITIGGKRLETYWTPEKLAQVLGDEIAKEYTE